MQIASIISRVDCVLAEIIGDAIENKQQNEPALSQMHALYFTRVDSKNFVVRIAFISDVQKC